MFNFERLEVWHKATALAGLVYRSTRAFPTDEKFGLTNQIRRAATSVSSNIAEGSARSSADFAKFLSYAAGSVYEVVSQATIARNEGLLDDSEYRKLYAAAEEIARMLSGLRKSLND